MSYAIAVKAASLMLASGVAAAGGAAATHKHSQETQFESVTRTYPVYTVRHGDTLFRIAARFCRSGYAYPSLAAANGIPDANRIRPGQRVVLSCMHATYRVRYGSRPPVATTRDGGRNTDGDGDRDGDYSDYAAGSANVPGTSTNVRVTSQVYSYAGLESLWRGAGGRSGAAATAACIAEAESGGRSSVISPTNDWGLWQIHNGGPAMLNPYANAARAVAMSGNGTNWSAWTTHSRCGV